MSEQDNINAAVIRSSVDCAQRAINHADNSFDELNLALHEERAGGLPEQLHDRTREILVAIRQLESDLHQHAGLEIDTGGEA
jgi:hypothetical protein